MNSKNMTFFYENGYVLIKNAIPDIQEAQKEILAMVEMAKVGKLKSARSFRHYPKFIDGDNIGQIDLPWEDYTSLTATKKSIEGVDFKGLFKEYINADYSSYIAKCFRMHVTSRFFKYMQPWHRDLDDSTPLDINSNDSLSTLRMNLYFFDESGFQIVPKTYKPLYMDRIAEREIWVEGKLDCKADLKNAHTIKASAGDILIFHPNILHRGWCAQKRASFHVGLFAENSKSQIKIKKCPNNLNYQPDEKFAERKRLTPKVGIFTRVLSLALYLSPLPSRQYYRFLLKKPDYLINNFIQRNSIFQKERK